ncbi:hypothetical protein NFI96_011242, partial [Prochilodus magdalenae]
DLKIAVRQWKPYNLKDLEQFCNEEWAQNPSGKMWQSYISSLVIVIRRNMRDSTAITFLFRMLQVVLVAPEDDLINCPSVGRLVIILDETNDKHQDFGGGVHR